MGSPEKPLDVEMGDMSDETHKLNPTVPDVKVENGIKSEESEEETRFTGLKKEELLEISNQPKWVRARWVLFILFWLAWIGMLVAAILIVVNAPRCKPEPKPEWYQDTVVYEVNAKNFAGGFKGMESRLEYLKELSAETVLLTDAASSTDQIMMASSAEQKTLIEALHGKNMKVMVDLNIATMPVTHTYFTSSESCVNGTGGDMCDFFMWSGTQNAADATSQWVLSTTRSQYYKAVAGDNATAFINYNSAQAKKYLKDLVKAWYGNQYDGIQLRDFNKVETTAGASSLLQEVWNTTVVTQNTSKALFAYSSSTGTGLFSSMATTAQNTDPNPVIVNGEVSSLVGQSNAGKLIQTVITNWRQASTNIGAYTASPLGQQLAAERISQYAAGLNVLTIALPGVPVIRSGDEAGLKTDVFQWTDANVANGTTDLLGLMKEMTVRKVEGIQSLHSMRFDTRNNDTTFRFLPTGSDDVMAFFRQWDTKPALLVVSNMSPNNATVSVASAQGLLDKDGGVLKEGKVIVATNGLKAGNGIKLEKLEVVSGATIVIGN